MGRHDSFAAGWVINIKRKCSHCFAHTTIDGVAYCWKCREKLPILTPRAVRKGAIATGISQAAIGLSLLGTIAATFWWALQ